MDDWTRAVTELPGAAESMLDELGESVSKMFLSERTSQYKPIVSASLI